MQSVKARNQSYAYGYCTGSQYCTAYGYLPCQRLSRSQGECYVDLYYDNGIDGQGPPAAYCEWVETWTANRYGHLRGRLSGNVSCADQ